MARLYLAALAACFVVACGGAIEDGSTASNDNRTTLSAPGVAPAGVPPYGAWDLFSLESSSRTNPTEVHGHFFMELREDGTAIARRCTKPYYGPDKTTLRCADSLSYDCTYGTVTQGDDGTWRVEFPDLEVPKTKTRGEVLSEPDGKITVLSVLPSWSAGHFARISDDSPTKACAGP